MVVYFAKRLDFLKEYMDHEAYVKIIALTSTLSLGNMSFRPAMPGISNEACGQPVASQ